MHATLQQTTTTYPENHGNFLSESYQKRRSNRLCFQTFCPYQLKLRIESKNVKNRILSLILPAAIDLVSTIIGDSAAQELKTVPLSNNSICKRIKKIADDINDQLVTNMCGNDFSLQLDKATISRLQAIKMLT